MDGAEAGNKDVRYGLGVLLGCVVLAFILMLVG